jgi:hypothetical protein
MGQFELSQKAKEGLERKRKEREATAEKRRNDANAAVEAALESVDYDETQLILHKLPEDHGGLVILAKPTPEYRASYQKRLQNAFDREGKRAGADPMAIIASFVENKKYLLFPGLSELQEWQKQYPDLYTTIEDTARQQCSGDGAGKG